MDFPIFVFTSPGPLACGFKQTYGQEIVTSQEDYDSALKAKFYPTIPEAIEAFKRIPEPDKAPDPPIASESPAPAFPGKKVMPSSETLAKAQELGISVDGRWGQDRLLQEIADVEEARHAQERV